MLLKVRATARTSCGDKPEREQYSGKFARLGNPSAHGMSATSVARFCGFIASTNEELGITHLTERMILYTQEKSIDKTCIKSSAGQRGHVKCTPAEHCGAQEATKGM